MMTDTQRTMVKVGSVIKTMPRRDKIKTSEYLLEGAVPVIDQSVKFIAGYINDESRAYEGPLPVIVFGDHTCIFKYINFRFAVGADGTQLIRPKDENEFDVRYLYYSLRNVPLEQFGYQRHFKYLKEGVIVQRSLEEQVKIADVLAVYDDLIEANLRKNDLLAKARDLLIPQLLNDAIEV